MRYFEWRSENHTGTTEISLKCIEFLAWISSDYFESLLLPQRGENDSKQSDEFQAIEFQEKSFKLKVESSIFVEIKSSDRCNLCFIGYLFVWHHRRTGNFLPGGAVNHLPKKFSQVAQIFTKQ